MWSSSANCLRTFELINLQQSQHHRTSSFSFSFSSRYSSWPFRSNSAFASPSIARKRSYGTTFLYFFSYYWVAERSRFNSSFLSCPSFFTFCTSLSLASLPWDICVSVSMFSPRLISMLSSQILIDFSISSKCAESNGLTTHEFALFDDTCASALSAMLSPPTLISAAATEDASSLPTLMVASCSLKAPTTTEYEASYLLRSISLTSPPSASFAWLFSFFFSDRCSSFFETLAKEKATGALRRTAHSGSICEFRTALRPSLANAIINISIISY